VSALAADALIVLAAVILSGFPLGIWACRREPGPLAARTAMATEDEQRSPDYCWTHGCHRSQCPGPH
jgi:hypothetical protein